MNNPNEFISTRVSIRVENPAFDSSSPIRESSPIDTTIQEIQKRSKFSAVKDFHKTTEYITYYASVLNLTALHSLKGLTTLSKFVDDATLKEISEVLGPVVSGLALADEAISLGDTTNNFLQNIQMKPLVAQLKKELQVLIDHHKQNEIRVPHEINKLMATLIVLEDKLQNEQVEIGGSLAMTALRIGGVVANIFLEGVQALEVILPLKVVTSLIQSCLAVFRLVGAAQNTHAHKTEMEAFHKRYICQSVKPSDASESVRRSILVQANENRLSQIAAQPLTNERIKEIQEIENSDAKIKNSKVLKDKSQSVAELVMKKHKLEKHFVVFELVKRAVLVCSAVAVLAVVTGLTAALIAGVSITPIGWVLLGLTIFGLAVSLVFAVSYLGMNAILKPNSFFGNTFKFLDSSLLQGKLYSDFREWIGGGSALRKELAELKLSNPLHERVKILEEKIEVLDEIRKHWVTAIEEEIAENAWADLKRFASDIKDVEEIGQILKDKEFEDSLLESNLQDMILDGANWKFLSSSDYVTQVKQQQKFNEITNRVLV